MQPTIIVAFFVARTVLARLANRRRRKGEMNPETKERVSKGLAFLILLAICAPRVQPVAIHFLAAGSMLTRSGVIVDMMMAASAFQSSGKTALVAVATASSHAAGLKCAFQMHALFTVMGLLETLAGSLTPEKALAYFASCNGCFVALFPLSLARTRSLVLSLIANRSRRRRRHR